MSGLFDFEHYYKEQQIKTDIKLDVSDIPLKASPSSLSMNDDGSIDEVNMNEIVTNNVMYRMVGMWVNSSDPLSVDERIVMRIVVTGTDGIIDRDEIHYIAVGYPLDDLVEAGIFDIPETRSVLPNIELTVGMTLDDRTIVSLMRCGVDDNDSEGTAITSVTIQVTPRYRLINPTAIYTMTPFDAQYGDTDQNFWHQDDSVNTSRALAGVGLAGDIYKGMKWYSKYAKKARAVYQYDSFVKMVNRLSKTANENNLGIKTCFYDTSFADPVEYTDDMSSSEMRAAEQQADWTRTDIKRNAKVSDVYGSKVDEFVSVCRSRETDPLPDIQKDESTALIPPVSDVFKKLFDSKEDLAQSFTDYFFETYGSLTSIRGVRRFMSKSLKRKLDAARLALKKTGTGTPSYVLDLASCRNLAEYFDSINKIVHRQDGIVVSATEPSKYRNFNVGVRMISQWGFNVMLDTGSGTDLAYHHVGVYDSTQFIASKKNLTALFYQTVGNPVYSDWEIATTDISVGELKNILCEYFTGMYNQRYGKSEGDSGYIRWYYDESNAANDQAYRCEVTYEDANGDITTADLYTLDYIPGIDTTDFIDPQSIIVAILTANIQYLAYTGSARAFVSVALREIAALLEANSQHALVGSSMFYNWGSHYASDLSNDSYRISIVDWDDASTQDDCISFLDFCPSYLTIDDLGQSTEYTINDCVKFATGVMKDALSEIDTILTVQGLALGPTFLLIQKLRLSDARSDYGNLSGIIDRIKWYQLYTNESVFSNKTYIGDREPYEYSEFPYAFMPARFLVPVQMYKRVKKKYKRWGRTRHKTVKRSIGVRWCEVTFVDNDVYESYPQNTDEPMQYYPIEKVASVSAVNGQMVFTFDDPIEGDTNNTIDVGKVTQFTSGTLALISKDGIEVAVTFNDAIRFVSNGLVDGITETVYVAGIYVPLENTAKSDERTKVRVEYKMPYIPYDSEIRRWAYMNYGAFDQDRYASESREVPANPDEKIPGWVIFKNSSKRIGDMRASMGIYDAVSILVGILRNTFGASCVELVETVRSKDDQELMCSGGGESTFLSWHNYGLAAKILINDPSTGMPIEEGSPQFNLLIDVAEAFTKACYVGTFGKPLNVVWCGRLKVGANNFVWEFLPIGVDHKDVVEFREALLNQEDPVASLGYVNVDSRGLVCTVKPQGKVPYILSSSSAYKNALIINGEHYVSPSNIKNYSVPHDIVLMNILEFCNLIKTKMQANGSSLNGRASMYEWKSLNDSSFKQLLLYYGLTGSITAARALVCGEYVEAYKDAVDCKYSEDLVGMVKDVLGNLYREAKVYVEDAADGGAWLSLADGKLHLKTTDIRPVYSQESKDNFYGERIAPLECTERGLYIDGVFRNEDWLVDNGYEIERVSDRSFIDGFDGDTVTGDDALFLHSLVATQIKEEFDKLRDTFENYGGGIMYDHFSDGPNASMSDMLENEFGLISAQDLIDFDNLRAIYAQKDIEANARRNSDGTIQGAGGLDDIFEKVVSNAELAGIRKASLTKEHINVNIEQNTVTTEELYRRIMKGSMTQATDMFSK